MFLGFINFYKKFIRNFNRVVVLLNSMLQTINNNGLNTQASQNKKNQDVPNCASNSACEGEAGESIKHLSMATKLTKPKLTKPKKLDFAFSGADFLTFKAKKTFIHLQKAFTKAPILSYFDLECHIRIKTDALEYAISRVLN